MAQTPSPASPSPTTTTDQDLLDDELVDLPGFQPGPPQRSPDPQEATTTSTSSEWSPLDDDEGSWGDEDVEVPRRASGAPGTGSSKASTDWKDLLPITTTLVAVSSLLVRWVRSRRHPLAEGIWVADEEDAEAIGAPLARIAARRSPISGEGSADMIDTLDILVGTTGYAMKNLEREALDAGVAIADDVPPV